MYICLSILLYFLNYCSFTSYAHNDFAPVNILLPIYFDSKLLNDMIYFQEMKYLMLYIFTPTNHVILFFNFTCYLHEEFMNFLHVPFYSLTIIALSDSKLFGPWLFTYFHHHYTNASYLVSIKILVMYQNSPNKKIG